MNSEPLPPHEPLSDQRKAELDEAWLESLLVQLGRGTQLRDRSRVADGIQALSASDRVGPVTARRSRFNLANGSSLAIAASLALLAIYLVTNTHDNRAQAAVARCQQATPALRQYRLQVVNQRAWIGRRQIEAQLYIDDKNRFVLEHPGWLALGKTWIGGDAQQRWIVPPRGPVVLGGEELVGGWLARKDIASPYLHMTTLLQRMTRHYSLERLEDENIESATSSLQRVRCARVHAQARQPRPNLPATIDLWADAESGIAQRVVLQWQRDRSGTGPLRWTLDLLDTPTLPEDWFEYSGHAPADRPILRARSTDDLETL